MQGRAKLQGVVVGLSSSSWQGDWVDWAEELGAPLLCLTTITSRALFTDAYPPLS